MVKQQDMATPAPQGCASYGVGPSAEAQRQANRALVTQAHEALFTRHDVSVLDTSFAPGFIEHSPLVGWAVRAAPAGGRMPRHAP